MNYTSALWNSFTHQNHECFTPLLVLCLISHMEEHFKYCFCYFLKVIAIAVIIKTFINGRKKNIEDPKPAVHISTSQKPSNRTTLKSVKKDETVKNIRKNSSNTRNEKLFLLLGCGFNKDRTFFQTSSWQYWSTNAQITMQPTKQVSTFLGEPKMMLPTTIVVFFNSFRLPYYQSIF